VVAPNSAGALFNVRDHRPLGIRRKVSNLSSEIVTNFVHVGERQEPNAARSLT